MYFLRLFTSFRVTENFTVTEDFRVAEIFRITGRALLKGAEEGGIGFGKLWDRERGSQNTFWSSPLLK